MAIGAKRKRTRLEIQRERQALQDLIERRRQQSRIRMQRMRERLREGVDAEIEDNAPA